MKTFENLAALPSCYRTLEARKVTTAPWTDAKRNLSCASVGSKKTSLVKIQKTFDVEVAEREYEAAVREVQDDRVEERLRKRKEMRTIVLAGGVALVALVRFVVCSSRKKKETSNHKSLRR